MLSCLYGLTLTSVYDYWKNHSTDWLYGPMWAKWCLCFFNMLSRLVIVFLPRSKGLFISWLQSLSAVILESKKIKPVNISAFPPSICHEVMGLDATILVYLMLSFKSVFCSLLDEQAFCLPWLQWLAQGWICELRQSMRLNSRIFLETSGTRTSCACQ